MAQHSLDGLDVGSGADRQAGRRVPKVMRRDGRECLVGERGDVLRVSNYRKRFFTAAVEKCQAWVAVANVHMIPVSGYPPGRSRASTTLGCSAPPATIDSRGRPPSKPSGGNQPGFSATYVPFPQVRGHGMTINYQFGDATAPRSGRRLRRYRPSIRPSFVACSRPAIFWRGAGRVACEEFTTVLGHNFQVVDERANAHGQKVQTAGSNIAATNSAVGSS